MAAEKPRQSLAGLWNISFGFFGIQIGFALQNSNMSRIFQTLGSSLDDLPALWVAAPLTGLLVQPIIGHMSDRTWLGRLGRRRPYFLAGALLAAIALLADAGIARAADGRAAAVDARRQPQHLDGAVPRLRRRHAAARPAHRGLCRANRLYRRGCGDRLDLSLFARPFRGLQRRAGGHDSRDGSLQLLGRRHCSVRRGMWTVLSTREYGPEEMAGVRRRGRAAVEWRPTLRALAARTFGSSLAWILAGAAVALATWKFALEKEVYLLGGLLIAYGAASTCRDHARAGRTLLQHAGQYRRRFLRHADIMKRLALVQFFSWSALFIMWINTTPVVARNFYHSPDPASLGFQDAGNWVGVLFAIYNGVAAVLPRSRFCPCLRDQSARRAHT